MFSMGMWKSTDMFISSKAKSDIRTTSSALEFFAECSCNTVTCIHRINVQLDIIEGWHIWTIETYCSEMGRRRMASRRYYSEMVDCHLISLALWTTQMIWYLCAASRASHATRSSSFQCNILWDKEESLRRFTRNGKTKTYSIHMSPISPDQSPRSSPLLLISPTRSL